MAKRSLALLLPLALLASGCATVRSYRYRPRLTAPGADILAALTIAGGNGAVDGNSVTPLENGAQAFPAMLAAIHNATSTIHMETYIFHDGRIGGEFVAALAERARAGVSVRLLFDAFGSRGFGAENTRTLEDAGAQIVFFHPLRLGNPLKIYLRTHRKLLIVDGRIGFTGGICVDDAWTGDATEPDHWRDLQVEVEGPVVRQMQAGFARAWLDATDELLSAQDLYPQLPPSGPMRAQMMESTPGFRGNPARLSFLVAVASARRSIEITNAYLILDHVAIQALERAARRGVSVRLLLPSRRTDSSAVRYAGRHDYKSLLEAGVEIHEFTPTRLHAKTMIVDGRWASVGSANLDTRSFTYNYEANLNVFNEGFARLLEQVFEHDLARSERVTLAQWRRRPWSERFLETLYGAFRSQY
jgi:cardiolipin synthase